MKVIFARPNFSDVQAVIVNTATTPREAYDIAKRVNLWLAGYALVAVVDDNAGVFLRAHFETDDIMD